MVVATGAGNLPFFDHSIAQGTQLLKKIEEWIAIAPGRVMVCEYLGGYEPAMLDQMTARLRYYAKIGLYAVKTTYSQGPANFRPMWQYVWNKMNWNPHQDAQALATDFIHFYYGAGAEPLCRYFKLTHEQYQKTLSSGKELVNSYPPDFYTEEYIRKCVTCFDEAISAVSGEAKLSKEIESEKMMFLQDTLTHLGSYALDKENSSFIAFILDESVKSADKSGKTVDFRKSVDLAARNLAMKKSNPKILDFIRGRVGGSPVYAPKKTKDGLSFSPVSFVGADFGPGEFGNSMSHKTLPCQPKICAGVLAAAKDSRGNPTNTEMKIVFILDQVPGNGAATLDLEGQDGVSKWGSERQLNILSHMKITVNGTEIYKGECGFVRGNWSRQTFEIPAGVLKAGSNEIAVKNVTPQTFGAFAACWVLISDAQLTFK
jgi:hypothetical protein